MAQLQRKNRVKDQTTTTGTGTITLGLVNPTGYDAGSVFTTGRRVKYLIQQSDGSEWELGYGIVTNTGGTWTVTRVTVEESSNSNSLVSFSAGTKVVVLSPPTASDFDVPEFATGANVASASTIDLDAATGERVHVTGTTTITAVTLTRGPRTVIFDGILTLTHHATNNNLPGAANIITAAGDRAIYAGDGTTVYCIDYIRANGQSVVGTNVLNVLTASNSASLIDTIGLASGFRRIEYEFINIVLATDGQLLGFNVSTDGGATYKTDSAYTFIFNETAASPTAANAPFTGTGTVGTIDNGISSTAANGGMNGTMTVMDPASAAVHKRYLVDVASAYPGSSLIHSHMSGFTIYTGSTTAHNAIKFSPSSGNITSGLIIVRGYP